MGLFPKNNARARQILDLANEWRETYFDAAKPVCAIRLFEKILPEEFPEFSYSVQEGLENLAGEKIDGTTTFSPHLRITIDSVVYDLARKHNDGASRFSICHEAAHLILHQNDPRAQKMTQLNRGLPFSGTSFKECGDLEKEANLFAGCLLVPHSQIHAKTTASEVADHYKVSIEAAERSLVVIRAAYPYKWRQL